MGSCKNNKFLFSVFIGGLTAKRTRNLYRIIYNEPGPHLFQVEQIVYGLREGKLVA